MTCAQSWDLNRIHLDRGGHDPRLPQTSSPWNYAFNWSFHCGKRVGGLYGLAMGKMFFGESMFHQVPEASKICLSHLVTLSLQYGIQLIDCQAHTPHLEKMGAKQIPRNIFSNQLQLFLKESASVIPWKELSHSSTLARLPKNWDKVSCHMSETNPEHTNLTKLGEGGTQPKRELETFPNRNPERDYVVELNTSEFTCIVPRPVTWFCRDSYPLCSWSKNRRIQIPKLYLWSFVMRGPFTNTLPTLARRSGKCSWTLGA